MSQKSLEGRVALVTGASRGFGAAAAKALAAAGAHVIITARTQGGLIEVDDAIRAIREGDGHATLVPLDLADMEGIDKLGYAVAERFQRLDILVHAAAIMPTLSPIGHVKAKEFDNTIRLNLTAPFRLARVMEPVLAQSDDARALFLTCAEAGGRPFYGAYAAAKAGLEAMVTGWWTELEKTKIRPSLLDPGPMATKLRAAAFPGEDPKTLPRPEVPADGLPALLVSPPALRYRWTGDRWGS
ncbi:MAG: SDR family NAD(P)-dependent oxidoreductase [Alphaproteobacteria bacterium]|nr:SDR family NAD(P)-dependent oxidoreductase [Alphaproteobacteria bacterium]